MTNIIVELKEYIDSTFNLSLLIDFFQAGLQEIMIRHEPSNIKETRYLDGSRVGKFNFSISAKSLNGKNAVDQLNVLTEGLDMITGVDLNPLLWIAIQPVTSARLVSKTEKNEFIYQASFELEYKNRRN